MNTEKLKIIALNFFPNNNGLRYLEEYYKTEEIKKLELLSLHHREQNSNWLLVFNSVKKNIPKFEIHDVSFKYDNFLTRCYSLVIYLGQNDNKEIVLDINISFIIPFYTIALLEFNIKGQHKWEHPPVVSFGFKDSEVALEVELIKTIIKKVFNYNEFPQAELDTVIPSIGFEEIDFGKFTFFNAFFCNCYQIRF